MNDATNDRRAELEASFLRDRERLYALCLRLTGRHDEAEDALQDTWLAACRAIEGFRGEARLATWLYRIAIRCATRVRARRRPAALDFEPSARNGPAAEDRERLGALLRRLDRLSADHRTVLALAALDGLGAAEIAEILGIPEGTVWSRLGKARRVLMTGD